MAKIVTLKNDNDEEVYPVTVAEAVNGGLYADNGTEVTGVVPDVTTSRIEDGAVTSDKIDWTTIKHSTPTATILRNIGTITSTQSYTAPSNGFLIGKGVSWANGGKAGVFLTNSDDYCIGGIPYTEYPGNNQVAFCIPVYAGQTVYFRVSGGSSRLEQVRLVASHSEASI